MVEKMIMKKTCKYFTQDELLSRARTDLSQGFFAFKYSEKSSSLVLSSMPASWVAKTFRKEAASGEKTFCPSKVFLDLDKLSGALLLVRWNLYRCKEYDARCEFFQVASQALP